MNGWVYEDYFKTYMLIVGALRVFGLYNAWVTPHRLRQVCYSLQQKEATGLQTRLFGYWTALSGTICFALAHEARNATLLWVGVVSFFIAIAHFATEVVQKVSAPKDAIAPFIVASSSLLMLFGQLNRLHNE